MSWRTTLVVYWLALIPAALLAQEPSLQLVPTGVITQPTSVVLQGVVTPGYPLTLDGAVIVLRYDPAVVSIGNPQAGTGWNYLNTNNDATAGLYRAVTLNADGMLATGTVLTLTVTPTGASADLSDCDVFQLVGGDPETGTGSNICARDSSYTEWTTFYPPGSCGERGLGDEATGGDSSRTTTGTSDYTDNETDPLDASLAEAADALRIAGGLAAATPENVCTWDGTGDGRIRLEDVLLLVHSSSGAALPTNLAVSPVPWNDDPYPTLRLTWQDNSNNETGFQIEQSLNGTTGWRRIYTTRPNVSVWTTPMLNALTTYYYRIRAIPGSMYSNVASATTHQGDGLNYDTTWLFPLAYDDPAARIRPGDNLPSTEIPPYGPPVEGVDYAPNIPNDWYVEYDADTGVTSFSPPAPSGGPDWLETIDPGTLPWPNEEDDPTEEDDPANDPTRLLVSNTTKPPYQAVCSLKVFFDKEDPGYATGFLVGKRIVVTAAHNVYAGGKWVQSVEVSPGKNGNAVPGRVYPYGTIKASKFALIAQKFKTPGANPDAGVLEDMALIVLPENKKAGNVTKFFGIWYRPDLSNMSLNMSGYPVNPSVQFRSRNAGVVGGSFTSFFTVNGVQCYPGDSGAPWWSEASALGGYNAVGVQTRADPLPIPAYADKITAKRRDFIISRRNLFP